MKVHVSALVCLFVSLTSPAHGQGTTQGSPGILVGYSFDAGGPLSRVQTLDLFVVAVRYARPLLNRPGLRIDQVIDFLPLILVLNNPLGDVTRVNRGWALVGRVDRTTTYGLGLLPLAVRAEPWPSHSLTVFGGAGVGAAIFADAVPAANSSHLNVVIEMGGGLRLGRRSPAIDLGFKLHHLSNAGFGTVNPALESKLFYLSAYLRR